jgi:hypothetical protein
LRALASARHEDAEVAPLQNDNDPHLQRLFADAIHWQEMLERLVELKQVTACSGNDAVPAAAKPDWQQRATKAR